MPTALPPPPERFDAITARWLTPRGPLHDPEAEAIDPDHVLPVELVGPVPRELRGITTATGTPSDGRTRLTCGRSGPAAWAILAMVALVLAAMLVFGAW